MYSYFNKITNYYVLYGNLEEYWKVLGKYSYSEFKKASGTDNVTVWINNTTNLSKYPEHITYKTIDEYKTEAESGRAGFTNESYTLEQVTTIEGANTVTGSFAKVLQGFKTQVETNKELEVKASDKLEVIQQLVNECAKQLGYDVDKKITVLDDYSTFTIGGKTVTSFTCTDGTNTYNIEYSSSNIKITKDGENNPIFTIGTPQNNPKIIENTIGEIKDNENNLVTNSFNTQYQILFNENLLTGSTTSEIVNNGLLFIDVALNCLRNDNMMQILLGCVPGNYNRLLLPCKGTAQWDWKECATTFTITLLKNSTANELIPAGKSITIKKYYSDDANAKNDITESDVLVELLKNNKLFYENAGTKYVFNQVDFSGMKYYCFLSKYIDDMCNNYIYCLKCALNGIKYDTILGTYHYNSGNYSILSDYLDDCENCSSTSNAYGDEKTYYDVQLEFLDTAAGGYQNRALTYDVYNDTKGQELCTLEHLKNGWKKQDA